MKVDELKMYLRLRASPFVASETNGADLQSEYQENLLHDEVLSDPMCLLSLNFAA